MKIFLFLYPISEYLKQFSDHHNKFIPKLDQIVHERYRLRGYHIYWVFFGQVNDLLVPETSQMMLTIYEEDRIISAGLSLKTHLERRKNIRNRTIFNQLPRDLKELVVGGFHHSSCVNRVAHLAYKLGINTIVDDDVTDISLILNGVQVPIVQSPNEAAAALKDYVRENPDICPEWFLKRMREIRKKEPWLAQIPE